MEQYKSNIKELNDVHTQQDLVLDELALIEGELDAMLPQYEQDKDLQALWKNGATASLEEEPMRNQVYEKAS